MSSDESLRKEETRNKLKEQLAKTSALMEDARANLSNLPSTISHPSAQGAGHPMPLVDMPGIADYEPTSALAHEEEEGASDDLTQTYKQTSNKMPPHDGGGTDETHHVIAQTSWSQSTVSEMDATTHGKGKGKGAIDVDEKKEEMKASGRKKEEKELRGSAHLTPKCRGGVACNQRASPNSTLRPQQELLDKNTKARNKMDQPTPEEKLLANQGKQRNYMGSRGRRQGQPADSKKTHLVWGASLTTPTSTKVRPSPMRRMGSV
jgi:hypothetical protein